jgi:hypothetical protein
MMLFELVKIDRRSTYQVEIVNIVGFESNQTIASLGSGFQNLEFANREMSSPPTVFVQSRLPLFPIFTRLENGR